MSDLVVSSKPGVSMRTIFFLGSLGRGIRVASILLVTDAKEFPAR